MLTYSLKKVLKEVSKQGMQRNRREIKLEMKKQPLFANCVGLSCNMLGLNYRVK